MLLLLACAHPVPPSPADCASGDAAACHAVAAAASPDDPTAWQLDRWACDAGVAEACVASADRYTRSGVVYRAGIGAAADLRRGCELGLAASCSAVTTLPDEPAARVEVGIAAGKACAAEDEAACARLSQMGWRNKEIAEVREVRERMSPLAVLAGGTVLGQRNGEILADGPAAPFRAPLSDDPNLALPDVHLTIDGRALTALPGEVWSLLDSRVVATRTWPPAGSVHAWNIDGSGFVAALDGEPLVAWWSLAGGGKGEVVDVGRRIDSLDLSPDNRWIAVGSDHAALVDRARGTVTELPCTGPISFSPSGDQLVCHDQAVRILGRDGKVQHTFNGLGRYAFSPDGERLAVVQRDRLILIDTTADALGTVRAEMLLPPTATERTPVWSPDGARLLLAGAHSLVLSRAGAKDQGEMDRAVVEGLRGRPDRAVGPVATREDANLRGVVRKGDTVVRGATMTITPCTPGPAVPPPGRSGHDGSYAFSRIARGCWSVRAEQDGVSATLKAVLHGGTPLEGDLILPTPRTLTGTVRGADGKPTLATVAAWNQLDGVLLGTTQTDKRGRYTLTVAGATALDAFTDTAADLVDLGDNDAQDLVVTTPTTPLHVRLGNVSNAPDGAVLDVRGEPRRYPQADGSTLLVGLPDGKTKLQVFATVAGRIFSAPAREVTLPTADVVEVPGLGLGRLSVRFPRLRPQDRIEVEGASCPADKEGCATQLAAGHYRVRAYRAADHAWGVVEVDVKAGEDTVIPAPLDGTVGAATGRVVDTVTGVPLAGVRLRVDGAWPIDTVSGPDGRFKLTGIEKGRHALIVNARDEGPYGLVSVPIDVDAEGSVLGDVGLPRR